MLNNNGVHTGLTKERKTVPLNSTIRDTQSSLNAESAFALDYAIAWLGKAGSLRVRRSAVIRRALNLYAEHLGGCTDPEQEVRLVHRASESLNCEAHLGAAKRLQAVPDGDPLPPYQDLLWGPNRFDLAGFNSRLEQVMLNLSQSKFGRLKGIKP
jgi:hypothetical protein